MVNFNNVLNLKRKSNKMLKSCGDDATVYILGGKLKGKNVQSPLKRT